MAQPTREDDILPAQQTEAEARIERDTAVLGTEEDGEGEDGASAPAPAEGGDDTPPPGNGSPKG